MAENPLKEQVKVLRIAIDQVDRDLQRLASVRRDLSRQIQSLRLSRGANRLDPDREQQVIESYVEALGIDGDPLAHALLHLCRGQSDSGIVPQCSGS